MGNSPRAPTIALLWGAPLLCFSFLTHLGQEQLCLRREDRGGSRGPGWSTPPWGRTVVLWREGSVPSPAPLGKSPCRLPGRPEVNFPIKAVGLVRQTAVLPSAGPGDEAGVGPGTELGRFLGTGVQNLGFPPSGPLSLPRWSSAIPNQRPGDQARKG